MIVDNLHVFAPERVVYRAKIFSAEPPRAQAGDLGPIYDAFGRENVQVIDDQ